jgi:hypothetical protein
MARVAVATGKAFAEADPDNADAYQTSAAKVRDDLMALGEEVDDILGGECLFDEAVVSHAAYGYLLEPVRQAAARADRRRRGGRPVGRRAGRDRRRDPGAGLPLRAGRAGGGSGRRGGRGRRRPASSCWRSPPSTR